MKLTGAGLMQVKSYGPLRLALTFDGKKIARAELQKRMAPDEIAAVLRKLTNPMGDSSTHRFRHTDNKGVVFIRFKTSASHALAWNYPVVNYC